MEKGIFDIDEVFAELSVKARACGDMLSLDEMLRISRELDADDKGIRQLLKLLDEEKIDFYSNFRPLNKEEIKKLNEKIKNSSEDERTAITGREDPVTLYLSELSSLPEPDIRMEKELLYDIQDGSEDALGKLIESAMLLPVRIAEEYIGRGVLFLDLVQEGSLVLMSAAAEADPAVSFSGYCVWKLDTLMQELTAQDEEIVKVPLAMAKDMEKIAAEYNRLKNNSDCDPTAEIIAKNLRLPLERVMEFFSLLGKDHTNHDDASDLPEVKNEADAQLSRQISAMLSSLPETEAKAISMKYGLGGKKEMTSSEIAAELGVSEKEADTLISQALKHLL